ncbi:hypothetical protein JYU34_013263 [Plutella xylostella]|uniref:Uncharacterized protein n=1 Tax=Plutella xylostella TaxID=51655 RepID=A0ABQ7Q9F4_PLUXY|nr:hypothetical protein JYU34_013263 [Plutella xylostella]
MFAGLRRLVTVFVNHYLWGTACQLAEETFVEKATEVRGLCLALCNISRRKK